MSGSAGDAVTSIKPLSSAQRYPNANTVMQAVIQTLMAHEGEQAIPVHSVLAGKLFASKRAC